MTYIVLTSILLTLVPFLVWLSALSYTGFRSGRHWFNASPFLVGVYIPINRPFALQLTMDFAIFLVDFTYVPSITESDLNPKSLVI